MIYRDYEIVELDNHYYIEGFGHYPTLKDAKQAIDDWVAEK